MQRMRRAWLNGLVIASSAMLVALAFGDAVAARRPGQISGQGLYDTCRSTATETGPTTCDLYIMGVVDSVLLNDWATMGLGRADRPSWCGRSPLTIKQVSSVVLQYLATHPGALTEPAAEGVYLAMAHAFPCPGRPPRSVGRTA